MWQKLDILQQLYFLNIYFDKNHNLNCVLIGTKDCWLQTLTVTEIKQTVELLNKRIEYNEYIEKVFLNDEVESATFEDAGSNGSDSSCEKMLNIKYNVQGLTLKFQWLLKRQTTTEFQDGFILPLLNDIQNYDEQIKELKAIIRLKDQELEGYRREGFILHRKTLSTKSFNVAKFNEKSENHMQQFYDLLSETKAFAIRKKSIDSALNDSLKAVTVSDKYELKLKEKISPQKRKHQAFQLLNKKYDILKRTKQSLQYESQSSTISNDSMQDIFPTKNLPKTSENQNPPPQISNKEAFGSNQSVVENDNTVKDDCRNSTNSELNLADSNSSDDSLNDFETLKKNFHYKNYNGDLKYLCLDVADAIESMDDITAKLAVIKSDLRNLDTLRLADSGKSKQTSN